MRKIRLTNCDGYAVVSDEDFLDVSQYSWRKMSKGYISRTYKIGKNKYKSQYMHRFIMNAPDGYEVDHLNHKRADNRRENLRICTTAENAMNRSIRSDNTSSHIGVNWIGWLKKWRAYVTRSGKQVHLGVYKQKYKAVEARANFLKYQAVKS